MRARARAARVVETHAVCRLQMRGALLARTALVSPASSQRQGRRLSSRVHAARRPDKCASESHFLVISQELSAAASTGARELRLRASIVSSFFGPVAPQLETRRVLRASRGINLRHTWKHAFRDQSPRVALQGFIFCFLVRTTFSVSQVSPDADEESIKSAYRRLQRQWHPDRAGPAGVRRTLTPVSRNHLSQT